MKKILLSSLFVSSFLLASESKFFMGLNLGQMETKISVPKNVKLDKKTDNAVYGLKLGLEKTNHRIYMDYLNQKSDKGYDTYAFILNADYIFRNTFKSFSPFLGLNTGYLHNIKNSTDLSGALYGINAGFLYDLTKDLSLEYKYSYMDSDSKKSFPFGEVKYKDIQTNLFTLNYKF